MSWIWKRWVFRTRSIDPKFVRVERNQFRDIDCPWTWEVWVGDKVVSEHGTKETAMRHKRLIELALKYTLPSGTHRNWFDAARKRKKEKS
jgi:hypothetical protein